MVDYVIPSAGEKYVRKAQIVRIAGSDTYTYAGLRDFTLEWGNEQIAEPVISSDVPIFFTGAFSGEISGRIIVSTDLDIHSLATPDSTTGEVPEIQAQWKETDRSATPTTKTWTIKFKITRIGRIFDAGRNLVTSSFRGILTARPSVA